MINVIEGKFGEWYDSVTMDGEPLPLEPSLRLVNHSPDGFAWGYGGSGPAQLALAVLLHAGVPNLQAMRIHQDFKSAFIQTLPDQGDFSLHVDVLDWVEREDR